MQARSGFPAGLFCSVWISVGRVGECVQRSMRPLRKCRWRRVMQFARELTPSADICSSMKHRLVYLLNVGQRRLQRWSQMRAAAGGVTAAQAGLLFFLGEHNGALMSEAAAALDLGAPGMSGLADLTEKAGLIERRADETDGRASRLWLTEAGRAARQRSKRRTKDLNAKLTAPLTDFEKREVPLRAASDARRNARSAFPQPGPTRHTPRTRSHHCATSRAPTRCDASHAATSTPPSTPPAAHTPRHPSRPYATLAANDPSAPPTK